MFEKRQMYLTETTCDKVTENTVAFQVSTIGPEIAIPYYENYEMWERLSIPMVRNPRRLTMIGNWDERIHADHVEEMCAALAPGEHYFADEDLEEKLRRVLICPALEKNMRLVAITIMDGRLFFKVWEKGAGGGRGVFTDIKILPTELRGCDRFALALQGDLYARSAITVRIACSLDGTNQHSFMVEQISGGRHNKVVMAKQVRYRLLGNSGDERPHFSGYMNTLTVH